MSGSHNHAPDVAILSGGVMTSWAWLAENHDQITAICAIIGAIGVVIGIAVKLAPYFCAFIRWARGA